jgi:hypothetical protein
MKRVYKLIGTLFVLDICLFVLGGIFSDDDSGVRWVLGGIGWFGFLLTTVVLIVLSVGVLVRRRRLA